MQKIFDMLLIFLFLAAVFAPLCLKALALGVQTADMVAAENRAMATKPTLFSGKFRYRDIKNYPEKMEAYLTDAFPFRRSLISCFMDFRRNRLSRPMAKGVIGKSGWLFFNASPNDATVDDFMGRLAATRRDFQALFDMLNEKRIYFESFGVKYYFLIAPNKVSVYPEHLPDEARWAKGESFLLRFMNYYRERIARDDVPDFIIDPTGTFLAAKSGGPALYFPFDTHWNWSGRLLAGECVLDAVRKDFPDIGGMPALQMSGRAGGGDLLAILNLSSDALNAGTASQPDFSAWNNVDCVAEGNNGEVPRGAAHAYRYRNAGGSGKAIFIGDSFFAAFLPLPEALVFQRAIFSTDRNYAEKAMAINGRGEKIDIVVEEIVERSLPSMIPAVSPKKQSGR